MERDRAIGGTEQPVDAREVIDPGGAGPDLRRIGSGDLGGDANRVAGADAGNDCFVDDRRRLAIDESRDPQRDAAVGSSAKLRASAR